MIIHEEYARFVSLASTEDGWKRASEAWCRATNHQKGEGGEWIKERQSWGPLVAGFAIDPLTWRYKIGGRIDHHMPFIELSLELVEEAENDLQRRSVEHRVIEGRLAYTDISNFPLATCIGMWIFEDVKLLRLVEEKILEFEIGLPMSSLSPTVRKAQQEYNKFAHNRSS